MLLRFRRHNTADQGSDEASERPRRGIDMGNHYEFFGGTITIGVWPVILCLAAHLCVEHCLRSAYPRVRCAIVSVLFCKAQSRGGQCMLHPCRAKCDGYVAICRPRLEVVPGVPGCVGCPVRCVLLRALSPFGIMQTPPHHTSRLNAQFNRLSTT